MMGFGDGVRPPIMTDSVAKDVMDAFDPSLHEILGADTEVRAEVRRSSGDLSLRY